MIVFFGTKNTKEDDDDETRQLEESRPGFPERSLTTYLNLSLSLSRYLR